MLTVEEIGNTNQLLTLEPFWNHLLSESDADNIFLTWEWIFNWWQVYKKSNKMKLLVLVLRDRNEEILAIAPLYIHSIKVFKHFTIREIRFLGTGKDVSPDYLDFVMKKGREDEAINTFFQHLHHKVPWDVLVLTDIPSTSLTADILPKASSFYGWKFKETECATCPYILLPPSWDKYLAGLSRNMRYNIKRRTKNIEKHFKANYFVWGEIATLPNAINKLAALHKKRWDSRSTDYAFSTDEFNAFQQAAARDFSRKGWLYLSCLELNGDIAGIFYDFLYRNKLYYFQGGFEPSFNKYSIGLVLRANVIRDAIESGVGEIDLLKGAYDHKYRWTSLDRQTVTLTVGRNSPASKLFFYKTFALPSTKAQIKNLLPHSALTMVHRIRRSKMTNTNIPTD